MMYSIEKKPVTTGKKKKGERSGCRRETTWTIGSGECLKGARERFERRVVFWQGAREEGTEED